MVLGPIGNEIRFRRYRLARLKCREGHAFTRRPCASGRPAAKAASASPAGVAVMARQVEAAGIMVSGAFTEKSKDKFMYSFEQLVL
jgi:hypothetical protein